MKLDVAYWIWCGHLTAMFLLATFSIAGQESAYCGVFVIGKWGEKKSKEARVKWEIQGNLVVAHMFFQRVIVEEKWLLIWGFFVRTIC